MPIEVFERQKLSLPIKIIGLVLIVGILGSVASSVFSLLYFSKALYILLGFILTGLEAMIASVLINIITPLILLIALYKHLAFAWKFGIGYFGFLAINTAISLVSVYILIPNDTLFLVWPALVAACLLITILGLASFAFWHYRKIL